MGPDRLQTVCSLRAAVRERPFREGECRSVGNVPSPSLCLMGRVSQPWVTLHSASIGYLAIQHRHQWCWLTDVTSGYTKLLKAAATWKPLSLDLNLSPAILELLAGSQLHRRLSPQILVSGSAPRKLSLFCSLLTAGCLYVN